MKNRKLLLKAMLSAAVASCLTVGGNALAGELGFGFAPGLVAGEDFVAGQLIVGYKDGASTRAVVSAAQMAGAR